MAIIFLNLLPYHNLHKILHFVWTVEGLVWRLEIIPFRHWLAKHEYDPEYLVLTLTLVLTLLTLMHNGGNAQDTGCMVVVKIYLSSALLPLCAVSGCVQSYQCLSLHHCNVPLVRRSEWNWMLALYWHGCGMAAALPPVLLLTLCHCPWLVHAMQSRTQSGESRLSWSSYDHTYLSQLEW